MMPITFERACARSYRIILPTGDDLSGLEKSARQRPGLMGARPGRWSWRSRAALRGQTPTQAAVNAGKPDLAIVLKGNRLAKNPERSILRLVAELAAIRMVRSTGDEVPDRLGA